MTIVLRFDTKPLIPHANAQATFETPGHSFANHPCVSSLSSFAGTGVGDYLLTPTPFALSSLSSSGARAGEYLLTLFAVSPLFNCSGVTKTVCYLVSSISICLGTNKTIHIQVLALYSCSGVTKSVCYPVSSIFSCLGTNKTICIQVSALYSCS